MATFGSSVISKSNKKLAPKAPQRRRPAPAAVPKPAEHTEVSDKAAAPDTTSRHLTTDQGDVARTESDAHRIPVPRDHSQGATSPPARSPIRDGPAGEGRSIVEHPNKRRRVEIDLGHESHAPIPNHGVQARSVESPSEPSMIEESSGIESMPMRTSQGQSKDNESDEVAHSDRQSMGLEDAEGAKPPDTSTGQHVLNNGFTTPPASDVNASVSHVRSADKPNVHETSQQVDERTATVTSAEQDAPAANAADPELDDRQEETSTRTEQALDLEGNMTGEPEEAVETAARSVTSPSAATAPSISAAGRPSHPDSQSITPVETPTTSSTTQPPARKSRTTKATVKQVANPKTKKSTSAPKQPRKPRRKDDVPHNTPAVPVAQMVPRMSTTTDTEAAMVEANAMAQADDTTSAGETVDAPTALIGASSPGAATATRGRRRAETPEDAEQHEIDPASTTLFELTRDTRQGKKSQLETAMQGIDWKDVARKRKEHDERIAAGEAQASGADASARLDGAGAESTGADAAQQGPRLKLVNGALVVDASSLIVSRRGAAGADAPPGGYEELEESDLTRRINSQSWLYASRREPRERSRAANRSDPWSADETEAFWEALRMFGTDFECISRMFAGRTRRHIKLKFTREERAQPARMRAALVGETLEMDMGRYCEATGREEAEYMDPRLLEEELKRGEEAHRVEMERQRGVHAETQKQRLEAEKAKAKDGAGPGRKGRGRRKQAEAGAAGEVLVEDIPDDVAHDMPGQR